MFLQWFISGGVHVMFWLPTQSTSNSGSWFRASAMTTMNKNQPDAK
jgi:hypothetical protein